MRTAQERMRAWWARPQAPYLASFLLQLLVAPFFIHDWDGYVFTATVRDLLAGITPYATAEAAPAHIFLNIDWPTTNSWFAYPPGALLVLAPGLIIALLMGLSGPLLLRVALKLPLIAGNLLLARVAGSAAVALTGDERVRRRAEMLILFNPFLIWIAAAWGMFDAWMMAFLILSALLLSRGKPRSGGVAFAAAASIKIFPLLIAPAWLVWAIRGRGARDATRFVTMSVVAFTALALPFFVSAPRGFYQQVLGMHLARPVQGFALVDLPRFTIQHLGLDGWGVPPDWLAPAMSTALLLPALGLVFAYAAASRPNLRGLFVLSLVGFLAVLFFGKVVNEQYFVMPIALLAILVAATPERTWRRNFHAWTWGGLVGGLIVGFHFLTLVPRDVAIATFGMPASDVIHGIGVSMRSTFGISESTFYASADILSMLAILPAFIFAAPILLSALRDGGRHLVSELHVPVPARRSAAAVALVALLLVPAATATLAITRTASEELPEMPPLPPHLVGASVYLWWNNPSHDPAILDGNWGNVGTTPLDGYYTSDGHRMEMTVDALRAADVDLAAVSYHGYEHGRYDVFARIARAKGLYFAPIVEASVLLGDAQYRATPTAGALPTLRPTDGTLDAIASLTTSALTLRGNAAHLRIDGAPVVFLADTHLIGPSWDIDSRLALAQAILNAHGSVEAVARAWNASLATVDDIAARFPDNATAFATGQGQVADDWRAAVDARSATLWMRIRDAIPEPLHLIATYGSGAPGGLDGAFAYAPTPAHLREAPPVDLVAWSSVWNRTQMSILDTHGTSSWLTAFYAADDRAFRGGALGVQIPPGAPAFGGGSLQAAFERAIETNAPGVLVASWNGHFDGTSIEPTREHGHEAYAQLARAIATYRLAADRASTP